MTSNNSDTSNDLERKIRESKRLYISKKYQDAINFIQESCLSPVANSDSCKNKSSEICKQPKSSSSLAELLLLLAKCYKGLNDLKNAILSCNSAIQAHPKWKDPYLYRSACFQTLETYLLESDGDHADNIYKDRLNADIIVSVHKSCNLQLSDEDIKIYQSKIFVNSIDEALSLAKDGQNIFVESGIYEVTSSSSVNATWAYFLYGKSVSLIGASTLSTVLTYKSPNVKKQQLETFLIVGTKKTTLIKRFTFRNLNPDNTKTKFIGVAAGNVQLEDCLFDGAECSQVDAVFSNSKICGSLADNYPAPYVTVRFSVFNHCEGYGAFTAMHAGGSIHNCYFLGCGRSAISASDSAKVMIENCEFAQTVASQQTISATNSDLHVNGCYIQGIHITTESWTRNAQAVSLNSKSVGKIHNNYFYKTGNGISSIDSELVCSDNMIICCSKTGEFSENSSTLSLYTAFCIKHRTSKCQILNNYILKCDVGIYVGEAATPVLRNNEILDSSFTGIFVECNSKPTIVGNDIKGNSSVLSKSIGSGGGLGILYFIASGGLLGKNLFKNYQVSPIMTFSSCHPLIKDNNFENVVIDGDKQRNIEKKMLEHFQAELFRQDEYFYVVDSEQKEKELQDVILKGQPSPTKSNENNAS